MVLGDESFYNVIGEEINRRVLVQIMIDYFNDKYPNAKITDFNDGSQIRNILESFAVDIYHLEQNDTNLLRAAFLSTSYGRYLDLFGEELNTPRDYGSTAWGLVEFTIPEPIDYNVVIPADTVLLSGETGLEYHTTIEVEIPIGETMVQCAVYSQVVGLNTNADPNTINLFKDTAPYNVLSVNNPNSLTGGKDSESDDEYRSRLLAVKSQDGFGSREHYHRLGEKIDGVHDVIIVNSDNNYTGKVIVNGDDKPLSEDILALVVAQYTIQKNLVYDHSFEVEPVNYTTVNLELGVSVSEQLSNNFIIGGIRTLFNGGSYSNGVSPGLNINQALSKYLILNCIESLDGVIQVTELTSDNNSFNRLTPGENTVLMLGNVYITQNVE